MSTTIDEKALADYEALCASPNLRTGPWRVWYDDDGEGDEMGLSARWPYQLLAGADGETDGEIEILDFTGGNIPSDEEAEFIAASRTMGPLLAAKVRELKAENASLRAGIATLKASVIKRATPDADDASDTLAAIDTLLAKAAL